MRRRSRNAQKQGESSSENLFEISPLSAKSSSRMASFLHDYSARNVLTSNSCIWNAGHHPPASLTLDLGSEQPVHCLEMVPAQLPHECHVEHRLVFLSAKDERVGCFKIAGAFHDDAPLRVNLPTPVHARYVTVTTLKSESYVAWRRIRVWGLL